MGSHIPSYIQTQAACTKCGGEGTIIKNKCKECGGDGIVKGEELVEINIPAGVDNDMVVTVEGKGNQGKHNGLYGNLQVMVSVEKNDDFERVGQDLYHNLVLDFATATLGGEVEVPTLDGKTKIKIEPGTQPGKQIRLRGKGMPAIKGYGYGRGDIIVNITVFIPTSLTKEEKDLVVKFKECDNFKADNAEKKSLFESFKNLFKIGADFKYLLPYGFNVLFTALSMGNENSALVYVISATQTLLNIVKHNSADVSTILSTRIHLSVFNFNARL